MSDEPQPIQTEEQFRQYVVSHLATLGTQMTALIGNGQPGRLGHLETKVRRHERLLWLASGGALAIGYIVREVFVQIAR